MSHLDGEEITWSGNRGEDREIGKSVCRVKTPFC